MKSRIVFLLANTRYDSFQASSKLTLVIGKAAGKNLSKYALTPGDSKQKQREKSEMLLKLLSLLMEHARDREFVDKRDFRNAANALIRDNDESPASGESPLTTTPPGPGIDRIRFLSDSVTQACFPMRIAQTMRSMDVASFHGTQWLKANRAALEERVSRGHIAIRIALADPDSGFLEPYARLKGPGADVEARPEIMRRRIEDAEKAWLEICGRAIADGAPGVELQISHFKQVPAFAVHRFDGVLVLTPNHNPSAGSCFPAIECEDTGQPFCAYRMFLDEFDTLMDDERESNRRSLSSARAFRVTALNTDAFLHGLAITCGNNKESTRTIDALSRKPLTNTAKLRVLRAVEDALEQESLQKSIETSMSIAQFILEASGIDLREDALSVIDTGAEHAAKNGKLLAALRIMMNSITCDQNIDVQVAKSLMERY